MAESNICESTNVESVIENQSTSKKNSLEDDESTARPMKKTKYEAFKEDTEEGIGCLVADHYNNIAEKGLGVRTKSRIVYMRNFNNWVKSFLIAKFLDLIRENSADEHKIVALDLGAGKGGDLFKWQKGQIRHLICADIAEESIAQCKERYENFRNKSFTAEFIRLDCSKSRLKQRMKVLGTKVDIASCQFALHYSFESLPQAETMIRNAAESLRKGGYFICTIPDAYKIRSLVESSKDKRTFKNEVFKIEFPEDRPATPNLFGDRYNFFLEGAVNCPEFLIHYATLLCICKKYGLAAVYNKSFEEIYEEGLKERDSKSLLFRMKALESFPSSDDNRLSSANIEEYSHAQIVIDNKEMNCVKTITKSEWEAICIYMAVAFKKVT